MATVSETGQATSAEPDVSVSDPKTTAESPTAPTRYGCHMSVDTACTFSRCSVGSEFQSVSADRQGSH